MTAHYRHLAVGDRLEIERLLENGTSRAEIARRLGVHRSTITRELVRGSWQPEHDHANLRPYLRNRLDTRGPHDRLYLGGQAQLQADARAARSHQRYRMTHDALVDWVISALRRGWTPEEIAGRLPFEFPDDTAMRVSVETLYGWIYDPEQAHRQLWQYLPRGRKKRRKRGGRRVHSERIKFRTSIHNRPAVVEDRVEFGHWESDSVLGLHGTGGLHTTVERRSRYLQAVKIPQIAAQPTLEAQLTVYSPMPAHAVRSVTGTTAPNSRCTTGSPTPSRSRPISPTRTAPGNAARTSTSTAESASTSPRAPASKTSPRTSLTRSSPRSTIGPARSSAGQHPPKSSKNYARYQPQPDPLHFRSEPGIR